MSDYLAKVSVLIVDDQEFICSVIRQVLKALGCKNIYEAENGVAAWDVIIEANPDMIITDWEMHPANGLKLTHRIRTDPESPNPFVPIIMVTGHAEVERVLVARDAGINEYVIKPISAKALCNRIVKVVEHPREFVRTKTYFGPDRRHRDVPVDDDRRKPTEPVVPQAKKPGNPLQSKTPAG